MESISLGLYLNTRMFSVLFPMREGCVPWDPTFSKTTLVLCNTVQEGRREAGNGEHWTTLIKINKQQNWSKMPAAAHKNINRLGPLWSNTPIAPSFVFPIAPHHSLTALIQPCSLHSRCSILHLLISIEIWKPLPSWCSFCHPFRVQKLKYFYTAWQNRNQKPNTRLPLSVPYILDSKSQFSKSLSIPERQKDTNKRK